MKSGHRFALLVALFLGVSYSTPSFSQDRTSLVALNNFLSTQEERNAARFNALNLRNLSGSVGPIVESIRAGAVVLPSPPIETPPAAKARLESAFAQDLAQYALALGLDEFALRRSPSALRAISRIMRAQARTEDFIVASDTIFIAVATGKDNRISQDGYRSGHRFVVIDPLKGGLKRGSKVVLRQRSGLAQNGVQISYSNDISPAQGRKYLLFLSRSYYLQSALENDNRFILNTPPQTTDAMLIAGAYEVQPSKIKSITPMTPEIRSLEQFKEQIENIIRTEGAWE